MSRLFAVAALALLCASPALAQRSVGLGGQVGDPTGVTLRVGTTGPAVDIAVGWDIRHNNFFAQVHFIPQQMGLGVRPAALRLFYGPGLFIGVNDNPPPPDRDRTSFGVSFNAGLSFWTGPVEIFGQLTPRLLLIEATDFDLGGAVGLRYYFSSR